jgi:hypothetical protein
MTKRLGVLAAALAFLGLTGCAYHHHHGHGDRSGYVELDDDPEDWGSHKHHYKRGR